MDKIETIKENIRTIDPRFTDELLELLYEYVSKRSYDNLMEGLNSRNL